MKKTFLIVVLIVLAVLLSATSALFSFTNPGLFVPHTDGYLYNVIGDSIYFMLGDSTLIISPAGIYYDPDTVVSRALVDSIVNGYGRFSGGGTGGWTDDGNYVRLTTANDSVGIGTSTPGAKLHVEGDVIINGDIDSVDDIHGKGGAAVMSITSNTWIWAGYNRGYGTQFYGGAGETSPSLQIGLGGGSDTIIFTTDLTLTGANIVMSGAETVDGVDLSALNTGVAGDSSDWMSSDADSLVGIDIQTKTGNLQNNYLLKVDISGADTTLQWEADASGATSLEDVFNYMHPDIFDTTGFNDSIGITANGITDAMVTDALTVTGYMQDGDINTFAKLQSWVSDKTLVNEEDGATIDVGWTFAGLLTADSINTDHLVSGNVYLGNDSLKGIDVLVTDTVVVDGDVIKDFTGTNLSVTAGVLNAAGTGLTYWTESDDNDTSVFTATGPNTTVGLNDNLTMQGNDITGVANLTVVTGITVPNNSISDEELDEGANFNWTGNHIFQTNTYIDDGVGDSPSLIFQDADNQYLTINKDDDGFSYFYNVEGAHRFYASDDADDYIYFDTFAADVPMIATGGNCDLVLNPSGGYVIAVGDITTGDTTTGDVDVFYYFAVDGSWTTKYIRWDDGNSWFEINDELLVTHLYATEWGQAYNSWRIGNATGPATPTLYFFDGGVTTGEYLRFDTVDANDKFELSNDIDINGSITGTGTVTSSSVVTDTLFADSAKFDTLVVNDYTNLNTGVDINLAATDNVTIDARTNTRTVTVGALRLNLTPQVSTPNTRAIYVDVDANSVPGTQGLHIHYEATALAAGETGIGIDVEGLTSTSTGGDIQALKVSRSGTGSAEVHAIHASAGVHVIDQLSGSFVSPTQAWGRDTSLTAWANLTSPDAVGSSTIDSTLFEEVDDYLYVGNAVAFNEIDFVFNTFAGGSGISPTFEFSIAGPNWTTFTPIDNTDGCRQNGGIEWAVADLTSWASVTVNGIASYYVRILRNQAGAATAPIEDRVRISVTTEYQWNSDGDLNINSLDVDGNVTLSGTVDTVDVGALAAKVHKEDLKYFMFNLADPDALYATDAEWSIDPRTAQAITIDSFTVSLNADPTTELEFSLMFADALIGLANAVVIDDTATVAGVTTVTGGFGDPTVPVGKCVYWLFDADPDDAITQVSVKIHYSID